MKTNKRLRKINKDNHKKKPKIFVNKYITLDERCLCPKCISFNVYKHDSRKRTILDLKFMTAGIKRWVIEYKIYRFKCNDCGYSFVNPSVKKTIPTNLAKLKPEDIALNNKIALRIKELRIKSNPNQSKFAECHFIDRQLVSRWENTNDKRGVSIHTVKRFCNLIGITLTEFFDSDLFK